MVKFIKSESRVMVARTGGYFKNRVVLYQAAWVLSEENIKRIFLKCNRIQT